MMLNQLNEVVSDLMEKKESTPRSSRGSSRVAVNVETALTQQAQGGGTRIHVKSIDGFKVGDRIMFGGELAIIRGCGTIRVGPLLHDHGERTPAILFEDLNDSQGAKELNVQEKMTENALMKA